MLCVDCSCSALASFLSSPLDQNRCIGELSFRSEVRAVKLRRDRVVVVLEYKIYVYNFADLKLLDHIETTQNSKGLCALCPYSSNTVLVCPGLQKGHVRVELYDHKVGGRTHARQRRTGLLATGCSILAHSDLTSVSAVSISISLSICLSVSLFLASRKRR